MIEHIQAMNKEEICKLLRATHTTENLNTTELQLLMRRAAHFLDEEDGERDITERGTGETLSEPVVGGLIDWDCAAYIAAQAAAINGRIVHVNPDDLTSAWATEIAVFARLVAQKAKSHFAEDN